MKCKQCGDGFDTENEAMDHVRDSHTSEIDEELNEYISDAEKTVYENLIDES